MVMVIIIPTHVKKKKQDNGARHEIGLHMPGENLAFMVLSSKKEGKED